MVPAAVAAVRRVRLSGLKRSRGVRIGRRGAGRREKQKRERAEPQAFARHPVLQRNHFLRISFVQIIHPRGKLCLPERTKILRREAILCARGVRARSEPGSAPSQSRVSAPPPRPSRRAPLRISPRRTTSRAAAPSPTDSQRHPEQQPLHQQTHSIRRTVHRISSPQKLA